MSNNRTMDRWEGIDSFAAVAETGSFTRAAAQLGRSISQVSREVSRLEARLGVQLLKRTTRRLALTQAGRLFEQRCRRLIAERDDAFGALAADDREVKGQIRLTCPVAYGERAIVPIVNRFMAEFPRVGIHIELNNNMLDMLSEGIDLAIRVDDRPDHRLVRRVLASRTLYCCASPDYLEKWGAPSTVMDLEKHQCLQGSAEHWRFTADAREMLISPRGRWRCNSGFAVVEAALSGLGVCQLPDFYVKTHLASGALMEILPLQRPKDQEIVAVYPVKMRHATTVLTLTDFIGANLALADESEKRTQA